MNLKQYGLTKSLVIIGLIVISPFFLLTQSRSISQPIPTGEATMTGEISPAGIQHPGQILFEDRIENRQWTRQANEVPESIAWVENENQWYPVVRIEITGTTEQRRITKYGENDTFLETTIQSPPPQ